MTTRGMKNIFSSENVMLGYPDYTKWFDFTSADGIDAVLDQWGRPIPMISRTLKDREWNDATNEHELLAIVYALGKLRHYRYEVRELKVFTAHQPFTFAISEANPNVKIKSWRARIDVTDLKLLYKAGKYNFVADALSINSDAVWLDAATVHSALTMTYTMDTKYKTVNCFRNQIILKEASFPFKWIFFLFSEKTWLTI